MPQLVPFSAVAPVNAGVTHRLVSHNYTLGAQLAQVAMNAPARVGLVFSNTGGSAILLYPDMPITGNGGLLLPPSTSPFILDLDTMPGLVVVPWYAASSTGNTGLTVISSIAQG